MCLAKTGVTYLDIPGRRANISVKQLRCRKDRAMPTLVYRRIGCVGGSGQNDALYIAAGAR